MGIVGCGWAGKQHARAIRALAERVELRAVADVDSNLAEARAQDWQVPVCTDDYRELLALKDIDAVSICLPHLLHAPVVIEAAQAELHLLMEKPLATTLPETDSMIVAAEVASATTGGGTTRSSLAAACPGLSPTSASFSAQTASVRHG